MDGSRLNVALSGTGDVLTTGSVIEAEKWQHVAFTFDDDTDVLKIYVNGILEAEGTFTSPRTNTTPVTIGANSVSSEQWKGDIDEVRIWSVACTQKELASNLGMCLSGNEGGLEAYYNFEKYNALSTEDASNNSYTGNFVGTPSWVPGVVDCDCSSATKEVSKTLCAVSDYVFADGFMVSNINDVAFHTSALIGKAAGGCDSVITETVNVVVVDASVTQSGDDLTANAAGLSYQWLDCKDDSPIDGHTDQTQFNYHVGNGSYAVEVTSGVCKDTSDCYEVLITSLEEDVTTLELYPNPISDRLYINVSQAVNYTITDLTGNIVTQGVYSVNGIDLSSSASGIYFLKVDAGVSEAVFKVIKD